MLSFIWTIPMASPTNLRFFNSDFLINLLSIVFLIKPFLSASALAHSMFVIGVLPIKNDEFSLFLKNFSIF